MRTKIESVETILWDKWLILKIVCEDGTIGIGEGGVHGWQKPTKTAIDTMGEYLIGKDPYLIEHHYQFLYRSSHFMGSVIQGALSAIDIALWDIKGKKLDLPIYELLSGKTRDKVRCFMHISGKKTEELVRDAREKVDLGFTAIRFTPYSEDFYLYKSLSEWTNDAYERIYSVIDEVGKDVDICVEIHRQMNPAESVSLAKKIKDFDIFFYEDPMLPDSPSVMKQIKDQSGLPIATGERFTSIYDFQNLLELNATDYIRPDLCLASGISGCKKISAMAEAKHIKVIPHNPLSPISTAACVQLDASIPNFALQEYTGETEYPKNKLLTNPLKLENGYLIVPEGPGLGIDLNYESINDIPENPKVLDTPIGFDGSVKDR